MDATSLLIGAAELQQCGRADLRIIDCRFELTDPGAGRRLYREGHIPGAVFADLDRDLAGPVSESTGRHPLPDAAVLAATFGRLGIGPNTKVVVHDSDTGALAARAWWLLRWLGHDDVRMLDGGLRAWLAHAGSLERGDTEVAPAQFEPKLKAGRVVTTQEIAAGIAAAEPLCIVDARGPERFRGDVEPIDAVAGHIPGALNMPFTVSLAENATWKPQGALQAAWQGVLGNDAHSPWAVMCGSGVTACHLVASALMAGLPEPGLYVGSWSEWIRDRERPVATGSP